MGKIVMYNIEEIIKVFEDNQLDETYEIIEFNKGISEVVLLNMKIRYKDKIHDVKLIKEKNNHYFIVKPYKNKYYKHKVFHEVAYYFVLLAIKEHTDVHKY